MKHNIQWSDKRRVAIVAFTTTLIGLTIYLLSYPQAVKSQLGRAGWVRFDGSDLPLYKPVTWMIDHTPLRSPLFWWAERIGMGDVLRNASGLRRGTIAGVVPREFWCPDPRPSLGAPL